ncbi:ABC transporter substrate-binding protein [Litchfieldella qijiaojingensis]|uniref:ABC transporter substrate-binding protein n=1 Tax=Litchfieldella qijiaojingensis TaxID=980347 RepID=A0ABQ2Z5X2_9GAMM|nr:ABC transporter substrate-binding protein [Halomonas qijiaojingensis]
MLCWFVVTVAQAQTLRVGVLQFGTVNWELEVVQSHRLLEAYDIELEVVPLASENALAVALQGGRVDLIVSDWLWAARQRDAGRAYQFAPYSLSVGAVMVAPEAGIGSVEELAGHQLGIAGGPVDKTWILLRAYARRVHGLDLDSAVEPAYAAPPMINALMRDGRLSAAINFWHYNARLQAIGMQPLVTVERMLEELGITPVPPLLGWVFAEAWAKENREALRHFLEATYQAKAILAADYYEVWESLRAMVKPENEPMFEALKAGYRAGIPERYGDAEIAAAQRLFQVLAAEGGGELTGGVRRLAPAVFWDGFRLP